MNFYEVILTNYGLACLHNWFLGIYFRLQILAGPTKQINFIPTLYKKMCPATFGVRLLMSHPRKNIIRSGLASSLSSAHVGKAFRNHGEVPHWNVFISLPPWGEFSELVTCIAAAWISKTIVTHSEISSRPTASSAPSRAWRLLRLWSQPWSLSASSLSQRQKASNGIIS